MCPIFLMLAVTNAFAHAQPRTPATVVQHNTVDLKRCWQRVARRDPTLGRAKLEAHVSIEASGHVAAVRFTSDDEGQDELRTCFTEAIQHWSFPAAPRDYDFDFPILLVGE